LVDSLGEEVEEKENSKEKDILQQYSAFFCWISNKDTDFKDKTNIKINFNILITALGLGADEEYFVRPIYKELAVKIYDLEMKNIILTGTPGIGKSLFIVYWLWYLLHIHNGNIVVYIVIFCGFLFNYSF
jgi:DNA replication protein DnaC